MNKSNVQNFVSCEFHSQLCFHKLKLFLIIGDENTLLNARLEKIKTLENAKATAVPISNFHLIVTHVVSALPHFDPIPLDICKSHTALFHKTQLSDTHQNELINQRDNLSLMNGVCNLTKCSKWCKTVS